MLPRPNFSVLASSLVLLACALDATAHHQLSVSTRPDAKDSYHTLEQARDAIREMKTAGKFPAGGVVVNIHGGVYPIRDTFALGSADAGEPGSPVVYRAAEGEKVVLTGGTSIPFEKFSKVKDPAILSRLSPEAHGRVVFANLFDLGIRDLGKIKQQGFSTPILPAHLQIYGNGQPFELAKWPNTGMLQIGRVLNPGSNPFNELHGGRYQEKSLINPNYVPRGGTFEFNYDRAIRWKQASDLWIQGNFSNGFANDNLKVKAIDFDKHTITTEQPHMFGIAPWTKGNSMTESRRYVVYNLLEELDQPGEYYVEAKTGMLYLIPREGDALTSVEVTVAEKPFIAIENTAHIRIEGITLEYGRGMGIYMENSEQVVLDKLTVHGFGTLGIVMGQGVEGGPAGPVHEFTGTPVSRHVGNIKAHYYENTTWDRKAGKNCTIQNCRIYNTGQGGVIIDGGSRITLSPGNNRIVNCELHHNSNLRRSYSPAVSVYGVGNAIRNCHIHHQPHNAVTLFGNDHSVEFNEIDHILQEDFDDMGACYMGRDPSEMGNKIVGNYFHDIIAEGNAHITGVYFDDGAGGAQVASNVFYKVGSQAFGAVFFHFGHRNTVENNIFIDCPVAVKFSLNTKRWEITRKSPLWKKRLFGDIHIDRPPYSERYPLLKGYVDAKSRKTTVRNNLLLNCNKGFEVTSGKVGMDQDGGFLLSGNRIEKIVLPSSPFGLEMLGRAPFAGLLKSVDGLDTIPVDKMGLQNEQKMKGAE